VKSLEDLQNAVQDPEYPERIAPDEKLLFDASTSVVTIGWEEVYVLDGKVVNILEDGSSAFAKDKII